MEFRRSTILSELYFISNNTKNHIPKAIICFLTLFKAEKIFLYFLVYSYLEWIDNCIDLKILNRNEASAFLKNQWEILTDGRIPSNGFESLGSLLYKSSFSMKNRDLLSNFFQIQNLDFERKFQIRNKNFLDMRNHLLGETSLNLLLSIFKPNNFELDKTELETYSNFYIQIDNLTDYIKDFELGYLNIPEESIASKEYSAINLKDEEILDYISEEKIKIIQLKKSCIAFLSNHESSLIKTFLKTMINRKYKKMMATIS
jgi:hypothetical protein